MIQNIQKLIKSKPLTRNTLLIRVCKLSTIYTDATKLIYITRASILNNTTNHKPTQTECIIERTILSKLINSVTKLITIALSMEYNNCCRSTTV